MNIKCVLICNLQLRWQTQQPWNSSHSTLEHCVQLFFGRTDYQHCTGIVDTWIQGMHSLNWLVILIMPFSSVTTREMRLWKEMHNHRFAASFVFFKVALSACLLIAAWCVPTTSLFSVGALYCLMASFLSFPCAKMMEGLCPCSNRNENHQKQYKTVHSIHKQSHA